MTEEELFLSVFQELLAEGIYPESELEEMTHKILDQKKYQEWLQEDPLTYMPDFIPEDKEHMEYQSIDVI